MELCQFQLLTATPTRSTLGRLYIRTVCLALTAAVAVVVLSSTSTRSVFQYVGAW